MITLFVVVAGLATYFSATRRVKEKSRKWFEENTAKLLSEIEGLRQQTKAASGEIAGHTKHRKAGRDEFDAAAGKVLLSGQPKDDGRTPAIDAKSIAVIESVRETLKTRPESHYDAEDHYARGLSYFAKGDHHSALESFRAASHALHESAPADARVRYLLAQGLTLRALREFAEAIAVSDEIDSYFGKDMSPGMRAQVVQGLSNKAVALGELGKSEEAIAVYDEIDNRFREDKSPGMRERVANGLGNKGFTLGKLDKSDEEIAVYNE